MKKVFITIAVVIIVALAVFFIRNKINTPKFDYEITNIEKYNYVKYLKDEKFGIIDRQGSIVIEAKYSNIIIPNPEKDIFICYNDEKSVVLNSKNETIFDEYTKVEPIKLKNIASILCYEKTALKYEQDGKYGLISFDGKQITKNLYDSIENLQATEGKMLVKKENKYGIININGATIVDTKYDKIATDNYYSEKNKYVEAGFIVSNTTNNGYRYGYIDYKGKNILNVEYNNILRITKEKDIYLIASKNGQYGLYKENKQLIKPEYQSISYTDNGGIILEKNGQFGIANLRGEIKVNPKYSEIEDKGVYLYAKNSNSNDVYDVQGNKQELSFNKTIYKTENENYRVTTIINNDNEYYGIENKNGTELVSTNYKYIEYIYKDYFIAENDEEKYGIINSNGKVLVDFENDLIQKIKNKDAVQAINRKNEEIKIYSSSIKLTAEMDNANLINKNDYIILYNKKDKIFLDNEGNEIEENSDIVNKDLEKDWPEKIKSFEKVQVSIEDVYYKE